MKLLEERNIIFHEISTASLLGHTDIAISTLIVIISVAIMQLHSFVESQIYWRLLQALQLVICEDARLVQLLDSESGQICTAMTNYFFYCTLPVHGPKILT